MSYALGFLLGVIATSFLVLFCEYLGQRQETNREIEAALAQGRECALLAADLPSAGAHWRLASRSNSSAARRAPACRRLHSNWGPRTQPALFFSRKK